MKNRKSLVFSVNRKNFMKNLIPLIICLLPLCWSCSSTSTDDTASLSGDGTSQYWNPSMKPFYHNVASGDPMADRVIIWTRVTPEETGPVEVHWQVASDPQMREVVREGRITTGEDRDYTVKVDVLALAPDTRYYYRFSALGADSPVGRTKTAPANGSDSVRFAVVSCSNFEAGYFNAFGRIAALEDLDAVLHLGDYIYEYEPGRYGDTTLGRLHLPAKEIVTLQDYRTRYSLYRLDEDFQRAHQMHPFVTIWDDHEISNNTYETGAENHQPDQEGDFQTRKEAARQAYFEWLPVREDGITRLYRHLNYGNLVDLIMLDERLAGRSPQVDSMSQPEYRSPDRSMLGKEQLDWFKEQLTASDATWKVIGNQVIFSDLDVSFRRPDRPRNMDAWDGYPAEKQEIIRFFKDQSIENVIFVSGDTHCSWAFEVPESIDAYRADSTATVAVEFGTTSISSPNWDEGLPRDTVLRAEQLITSAEYNPHLKFANLRDHGYLLLALTADEARGEWHYVESIREPTDVERVGAVFRVPAGTNELQ
jgi:alkaline phosphatase D